MLGLMVFFNYSKERGHFVVATCCRLFCLGASIGISRM